MKCSVGKRKGGYKERKTKDLRLGGRWASVGGLVRSLSIKGGFEVCSKDLFQRTEAASLGELAGGGDQKRLCLTPAKLKVAAARPRAAVVQVDVEGGDDVEGVFDTEAGVIRRCCLTMRPNSCRKITQRTGQSTDPCGTLPATAEVLDSFVEEEEPFRTVDMATVWTSRRWSMM